MSNNPLDPDPARETRISKRARLLWEEEGRPNVGVQAFREQAEFLIGVEDNPQAGQLPNPDSDEGRRLAAMVDEAAIQDNYGEFPGQLTDQGERRPTPMTRDALHDAEADADEPTADRRGGPAANRGG